MAKRKSTDSVTGNVTKERLSGTPFSSMAELNAASREIRTETWRQMGKGRRIKRELATKEEYRFFPGTLSQGDGLPLRGEERWARPRLPHG